MRAWVQACSIFFTGWARRAGARVGPPLPYQQADIDSFHHLISSYYLFAKVLTSSGFPLLDKIRKTYQIHLYRFSLLCFMLFFISQGLELLWNSIKKTYKTLPYRKVAIRADWPSHCIIATIIDTTAQQCQIPSKAYSNHTFARPEA